MYTTRKTISKFKTAQLLPGRTVPFCTNSSGRSVFSKFSTIHGSKDFSVHCLKISPFVQQRNHVTWQFLGVMKSRATIYGFDCTDTVLRLKKSIKYIYLLGKWTQWSFCLLAKSSAPPENSTFKAIVPSPSDAISRSYQFQPVLRSPSQVKCMQYEYGCPLS